MRSVRASAKRDQMLGAAHLEDVPEASRKAAMAPRRLTLRKGTRSLMRMRHPRLGRSRDRKFLACLDCPLSPDLDDEVIRCIVGFNVNTVGTAGVIEIPGRVASVIPSTSDLIACGENVHETEPFGRATRQRRFVPSCHPVLFPC